MLFPYTYVSHQMEKMQEFIDFIFHEVWCKAPIGLSFHPDLFNENPDLKEVMVEFGFAAKTAERGKKFYKEVKAIYNLFAILSPQEIDQFKQWYQGNNDLEKVCANDPEIYLARYADIAVSHNDLADQLGEFFKGLYSQSLLDLAALRAKIGDIDDHYQTFMQENKAGKCPFCGIGDIKGPNHTKREAYDHYLPKALYPFNSINFRNLAPACHECNSTYKLSKDPAHNSTGRRKSFYPFAATTQPIDIHVTLPHSNIENLKPDEIQLNFGPAAINEEIETWKEVYCIEERYKAKFCSTDAKDWIEQFRILNRRFHCPGREYIEDIENSAPFSNMNFLKRAFLKACEANGLLAAIENYT